MTAWRESMLRETTLKREAAHTEFKIDPATLPPKEWGGLHAAYLKNLLKSGHTRKLPYDKTKRISIPEHDEEKLLSELPKAGMFEDMQLAVRFVFRLLAHSAGLHDDDIGIVGRGRGLIA